MKLLQLKKNSAGEHFYSVAYVIHGEDHLKKNELKGE